MLKHAASRRLRSLATAISPLTSQQPNPLRPLNQLPYCLSSSSSSPSSNMSVVFTEDAPFPAGPYSQAIKTPFAIFCSGQIPCDKTGKLIEGTIQEKAAVCIKNMQAVLTAAGSGLDKVVKVNVFLSDMAHFSSFNEEYTKHFTVQKPARSCVAVKQLPLGVEMEMECVALP